MLLLHNDILGISRALVRNYMMYDSFPHVVVNPFCF